MRAPFIAIPFLIASLAVAQAQQPAALKSAIEASNAKWVQAYNTGNAAALAQFYTTQATILPAGGAMASGRPAIQQYWQGLMQSGLKNFALHTQSVEDYGRAVREIGSFTVDAPGPNGTIGHVDGKYVVVWKHGPVGWLLDTDIWNMDK